MHDHLIWIDPRSSAFLPSPDVSGGLLCAGIVAVECRRVGQRWLTSVLRWPLHLESSEMRRGLGTWPCQGGGSRTGNPRERA